MLRTSSKRVRFLPSAPYDSEAQIDERERAKLEDAGASPAGISNNSEPKHQGYQFASEANNETLPDASLVCCSLEDRAQGGPPDLESGHRAGSIPASSTKGHQAKGFLLHFAFMGK
jgi:hypothetical protein